MSSQSQKLYSGFEEARTWDHHKTVYFGLEGRVLLAEAIRNGVEPPEELEPGVLLKGAVHHIFAGPTCGKTWLALLLMKNAIERGQIVAFFDTENGLRIVAERLMELGVDASVIDNTFFYFPSLSLDLGDAESFAAFLDAVKPVLVVFDSYLDHLASAGLSENESTDIAKWAACYSRPARNRGCTVVILDHPNHSGAHARGSTRKKDEVDVQWRLTKSKSFDRQTVGEIVLKREKDREAALPEVVKFKVGGGQDGFVFERSGGSIEGIREDGTLSESQEIAWKALVEFGEDGASSPQWMAASGLPSSTFYDARNHLVDTIKKVEKRGKRFFAGREADGPGGPAGHAPDKAGHPSGVSGMSGGSYRPPDRTSAEVRAPKTEPDPKIRNQEPSEPSLDEPTVDQDVAAFLRNPPQWWRDLVPAYRRGVLDRQRLNPLASQVACAIYGSAHRWREVLPAIREAIPQVNGIGSDEGGG